MSRKVGWEGVSAGFRYLALVKVKVKVKKIGRVRMLRHPMEQKIGIDR
jgi:hypothetical protein